MTDYQAKRAGEETDVEVEYLVFGQTTHDRQWQNGHFSIGPQEIERRFGRYTIDSLEEAQAFLEELRRDQARFHRCSWWIEKHTTTTRRQVEMILV